MNTLAIPLVVAVLAGCASPQEAAGWGRALQQASQAAHTLGGGAVPGSVASGGTGYLPCARAQGAPAAAADRQCH